MKKILFVLGLLVSGVIFASDSEEAPTTPTSQIIASGDIDSDVDYDTPSRDRDVLPLNRRGPVRRLFSSSDDDSSSDESGDVSSGEESDSDSEEEVNDGDQQQDGEQGEGNQAGLWGSLRARMSRVAVWLQNAYQHVRSRF